MNLGRPAGGVFERDVEAVNEDEQLAPRRGLHALPQQRVERLIRQPLGLAQHDVAGGVFANLQPQDRRRFELADDVRLWNRHFAHAQIDAAADRPLGRVPQPFLARLPDGRHGACRGLKTKSQADCHAAEGQDPHAHPAAARCNDCQAERDEDAESGRQEADDPCGQRIDEQLRRQPVGAVEDLDRVVRAARRRRHQRQSLPAAEVYEVHGEGRCRKGRQWRRVLRRGGTAGRAGSGIGDSSAAAGGAEPPVGTNAEGGGGELGSAAAAGNSGGAAIRGALRVRRSGLARSASDATGAGAKSNRSGLSALSVGVSDMGARSGEVGKVSPAGGGEPNVGGNGDTESRVSRESMGSEPTMIGRCVAATVGPAPASAAVAAVSGAAACGRAA